MPQRRLKNHYFKMKSFEYFKLAFRASTTSYRLTSGFAQKRKDNSFKISYLNDRKNSNSPIEQNRRLDAHDHTGQESKGQADLKDADPVAEGHAGEHHGEERLREDDGQGVA